MKNIEKNTNNKHNHSDCAIILDTDSSPNAAPDLKGEVEDVNLSNDPISDASGPPFKPPLSIKDQFMHLTDKYKLKVSNEKEKIQIMEYLKKYNYYRLRGYWITLLDDDIFKKGVHFQDIIDIMKFDKEIRHLLFEITEDIEVDLRTKIAYVLSKNFGGDALNKHLIFSDSNKYYKLKTSIEGNIMRAIKNSNLCVMHNIKKYGKLPIWAIVEVSTFGNLSKLYGCLSNESSKREIASKYKLTEKTCKSWLQCLNDVRNACAHHERLYNRTFAFRANYIKAWREMKVPENDSKSLFIHILLSMRMIYTIDKTLYNKYLRRLSAIISTHKTVDLTYTSIPDNWKEILRFSISNLRLN